LNHLDGCLLGADVFRVTVFRNLRIFKELHKNGLNTEIHIVRRRRRAILRRKAEGGVVGYRKSGECSGLYRLSEQIKKACSLNILPPFFGSEQDNSAIHSVVSVVLSMYGFHA
jgi:hypothetical protein